jgi:hypothetical protein
MTPALTPVAGQAPSPIGLRRDSRGLVNGVTHATADKAESLAVVTTLCNRQVVPLTRWAPEQWAFMVATAKRLPNHEHGVCRRCVAKSTCHCGQPARTDSDSGVCDQWPTCEAETTS